MVSTGRKKSIQSEIFNNVVEVNFDGDNKQEIEISKVDILIKSILKKCFSCNPAIKFDGSFSSKRYTLIKCPIHFKNGKFTATFPDEAKKLRHVTYAVACNDVPVKIGKTGQIFSERVRQYLWEFNHPEREAGKKELSQFVREVVKVYKNSLSFFILNKKVELFESIENNSIVLNNNSCFINNENIVNVDTSFCDESLVDVDVSVCNNVLLDSNINNSLDVVGFSKTPNENRIEGFEEDSMMEEDFEGPSEVVQNEVEVEESGLENEMKSLSEMEVDDIIEFQTLYPNGFNRKLGGGGSVFFSPDTKPANLGQPATPPSLKNIDCTKLTPEKKFKLMIRNKGKFRGNIYLKLPPEVARLKNVVYRWKNLASGKRLIGGTGSTLSVRKASYIYSFNHNEKEIGQLPLPMEVRKYGIEKFDFGPVYLVPENEDPRLYEGKITRAFMDAGIALYNQKAGGGSSVDGESQLLKKSAANRSKVKRKLQFD